MSTHAKSQSRRRLPADAEKKGLALGTSTHERNPLTGSGSLPPAPEYDPSLTPASESHDFGKIAILPMTAAPMATSQVSQAHQVQMKLRVSQPGDPHEQEADAVAEQVMRLPDTATATEGNAGKQAPAPTAAPEAAQAVPAGGGQPLDAVTRAFMEPRLGHDFGQVRVHTDAQAAEAAEGLTARAYTVGRDIVFGAREYAPETTAGRHLLAHELTHVLQQAGDTTVARTIQREPEGTSAPAAVPDAVPGVASITKGRKMPTPDEMKDDVLANGIIEKQLAILNQWDKALDVFNETMMSSSDKEASPDFTGAIGKFIAEEVVGDLLKMATDSEGVGWAFKGLTKLKEEAERAEKAEQSATLRDFYNTHKTYVGNMISDAHDAQPEIVTLVGQMSDDMLKAESGKSGTLAESDAASQYGMMRMMLVDTFTQLDAREKIETRQYLFLKLSEEWMRSAKTTGAWGYKYQAVVVIRLNPDYSIKDAHIQGAGGQKIAEQLLKDHPDGVNVFNLEVPRRILLLADNGWPSVILSLDENNNDISTGSIAEGNTSGLRRKLLAEGLPPTKKLDGD